LPAAASPAAQAGADMFPEANVMPTAINAIFTNFMGILTNDCAKRRGIMVQVVTGRKRQPPENPSF